MFKTFALACLTTAALANSNADDTTGIFGNAEQWKTGTVVIDDFKDDIFYWMF
jgi:carboxypeptidase C (cathepsin A)